MRCTHHLLFLLVSLAGCTTQNDTGAKASRAGDGDPVSLTVQATRLANLSADEKRFSLVFTLQRPEGQPVEGASLAVEMDAGSVTVSSPTPTDANGMSFCVATSEQLIRATGTVAVVGADTDTASGGVATFVVDFSNAALLPTLVANQNTTQASLTPSLSLQLTTDPFWQNAPVEWSGPRSNDVFAVQGNTTDAHGRASASFGGPEAGNRLVCAKVFDTAACADVFVSAAAVDAQQSGGAPVGPSTSVVDGNGRTLEFVFRDAYDNPVGQASVSFSAPVSGAVLSPSIAKTGLDGRVRVRVSSTTTAPFWVNAVAQGTTTSVLVTFSSGPADANDSQLSLSVPAADANVPLQATATFVDRFGNAAPGLTIAFSSSDTRSVFTPTSATSDTNGVATATYVGLSAGQQTLQARGDGIALTANVQTRPGPAATAHSTLMLAPPGPYRVGSEATVSLQAGDAYGNPLQGVTTALSASSNAMLTPNGNVNLDAIGALTAQLTSASAGNVTVSAVVDSLTLSAQAVFVPVPVSRLTANPAVLAAGDSNNMTLTLLALDTNGAAKSYLPYHVQSASAGVSVWPARGLTDGSGGATAVVASPPVGSFVVRAWMAGQPALLADVTVQPAQASCPNAVKFPYAPAQTLPGNDVSFHAAVGDLDGDGVADLVVADQSGSPHVSVYRNNGNHYFSLRQTLATGGRQAAVALADLNGDGRLDVASVDNDGSFINVFVQQSNGNVALFTTPATGNRPTGLVAADFDNDHAIDLAVVNGSDNTVSVLWNNGSAAFPTRATLSTDAGCDAVSAGTLAGSPYMDIAVSSYTASAVDVFINQGNRSFSALNSVSTGSRCTGLTVADLDQDGFADVAAITTSGITVLRGATGGALSTASTLLTPGYPYSIAAQDTDHDTLIDLVTVNSTQNQLQIYRNIGNGDFALSQTFATVDSGRVVLALPNDASGVAQTLSLSGSPLQAEVSQPLDANGHASVAATLPSPARKLVSADLNGDTTPDVLAVLTNGNLVGLTGSATGALTPLGNPRSCNGLIDAVSADADGDGFADVIGVTDSPRGLCVSLGDGQGNFVLASPQTWAGLGNVLALDLDADGKDDLVATATNDNALLVLMADGNTRGHYGAPVSVVAPANALSPIRADVNGDGQYDVVAVSESDGNIAVWLAGMGNAPAVTAGPCPAAFVAATDLNGDGKDDLVVGCKQASPLAYRLLSAGDGTFQPASIAGLGTDPLSSWAVLDLNGDRAPDIVVFGQSGRLAYALNDSHGSFGSSGTAMAPGQNLQWATPVSLGGTSPARLMSMDSSGTNVVVWRCAGCFP